MCENILLLSEDEDNIKYFKSKLLLLRSRDKVGSLSVQKLKKALDGMTSDIVLVDETQYNREEILKIIDMIKNHSSNIEIIIINSDETDEFISECYDKGASNCIRYDSETYEYMMAVLNSFKMNSLKEKIDILQSFLSNTSSIIPKNDLIAHRALKEAFPNLVRNIKIKKGIFAIMTMDESSKTKVSMNRLAGILKKFLRDTDIIASALGYFYIILANVDLNGARSVISKISEKMGEGFQIRAGLSKIGNADYLSVEKQAKDSLKSAINNDEVCVSIGANINDNNWLSDDGSSKHFKLFQVAFDKKLKSIIEPSFYRFEKECESKIPNCVVNQYANRIECNFTLKKENIHSELIIRHDGYAKIKVQIIHSGLDTTENTEEEFNLPDFAEKDLNKLLKQLKNEFLQGVRNA